MPISPSGQSCWQKFLFHKFLSCVNDYVEHMVTFTILVKFYSIKYFGNTNLGTWTWPCSSEKFQLYGTYLYYDEAILQRKKTATNLLYSRNLTHPSCTVKYSAGGRGNTPQYLGCGTIVQVSCTMVFLRRVWEYHYTTLRVQYPYTLDNHSTTCFLPSSIFYTAEMIMSM